MTWFKIDDSFYDHPKVFDAPDCAVALWTRAGSWSARNLTDGFVPAGMPARLCDDPDTAVRELVRRGLWSRVKDGYRFHDWSDYQPSRESVHKERDAAAERKRRQRERQKQASESRRDATVTSAEPRVTPPAINTTETHDLEVKQDLNRGYETAEVVNHPDSAAGHSVAVTDMSRRDSRGTHTGSHAVSPPSPTRPDPTRSSPYGELPQETSSPSGSRTRGTRIPDDFAVTDEMKAWFAEHCPGVDGRRETDKFRDYWGAKAGREATKTDWVKTWRNWMRKAADDAGRVRPTGVASGANRHVDNLSADERRQRNPLVGAVRASDYLPNGATR